MRKPLLSLLNIVNVAVAWSAQNGSAAYCP